MVALPSVCDGTPCPAQQPRPQIRSDTPVNCNTRVFVFVQTVCAQSGGLARTCVWRGKTFLISFETALLA